MRVPRVSPGLGPPLPGVPGFGTSKVTSER